MTQFTGYSYLILALKKNHASNPRMAFVHGCSKTSFTIPNGSKNVKKNVYVIGHSPLGLVRTNAKRQLRTPTGGRQISWLFTRVAEKLNSGLSRTTSASGQNGI